MNYYRLYWKNNDGDIKYSPVLNVKIKEGAEGISVFPTITKDGQVTIQLHSGWEEAECKVLNILGQQVAAVITGTKERKEISLKSLPPGTYLLTFKDHERQLVYKVVYQP
jgi:hypothetical protein